MKNQRKKGFTIVELVIVIAVIAVLAAILIPTFANLINKANVASDTALVKNLNTILISSEATDGKNVTMTDALKDAASAGYTVEKLTPTSTGDILWDEENDQFVLINADQTIFSAKEVTDKKYKLWKIVDELPAAGEEKGYSYYLSDDFTGTDVTVSSGLDVGNHTNIATVTYTNETESKEVVIRTNGGILTVNGKSGENGDVVCHYNYADAVNVVSVGDHTYYEYGSVGFTQIVLGHYVVDESAVVSNLHIAGDSVIVEIVSQAVPQITKNLSLNSFQLTINGVSESAASVEEKEINFDAIAQEYVNSVVKIGEVRYFSLESAVSAAKAGDTIELIKNVDLTNYDAGAAHIINLTGKTLDLCGFTITTNNFGAVFDGSDFTIQNGRWVCANGGAYALFIGQNENKNVVLNNLTCVGGINVFNTRNVVIKETKCTGATGTSYYAIWGDANSEIIVQGGTYSTAGTKGKYIINNSGKEKNALIVIEGGTYIANGEIRLFGTNANIQVKGGNFNSDPSDFLATGCITEQIGNTWYVRMDDVNYKTLTFADGSKNNVKISDLDTDGHLFQGNYPFDVTEFLAEGYIQKSTGEIVEKAVSTDEYVLVSSISEITEEIDNAITGDIIYIKLNDDISESKAGSDALITLSGNKTLVFDMNGHNIINAGAGYRIFKVINGATLNIINSGAVKSTVKSGPSSFTFHIDNGTVDIKGNIEVITGNIVLDFVGTGTVIIDVTVVLTKGNALCNNATIQNDTSLVEGRIVFKRES